jgi:hypothetical protein
VRAWSTPHALAAKRSHRNNRQLFRKTMQLVGHLYLMVLGSNLYANQKAAAITSFFVLINIRCPKDNQQCKSKLFDV